MRQSSGWSIKSRLAKSTTGNEVQDCQKGDMEMYIALTGNKSGVYIDPVNCNAHIDYRNAININDVDVSDANNLVIHRYEDGRIKIIQVGGYSKERGLSVDMY